MRYARLVSLFALAVGLSACTGGGSGSGGSIANPPVIQNPPSTYSTSQLVKIPGVPPAKGSWSFDISFVDPNLHEYFLADRTNSGIDIISLVNNSFIGVAGQGSFVGVAGGGSNFSGPNGVLSIGGGNLMAGDGNSTLKVVNVNSMQVTATIPVTNPYVGPALVALVAGGQCATGTPTSGAANGRADELAYDPTDSEVLIIDDAACPAFGEFVSTVAPYNVLGSIAFTTATAGAEQPTWDPTQKKFLMAIPATIANPGGEIDVIDPKTFAITGTFSEPASCNGNGTALGPNETLFIGCSNGAGPLVLMNAATGATIATVAGAGGCDEVWYNPNANRFYAACSNFTGGATLAVVSPTGTLLASLPTGTGAHSVAVDPFTDNIFVPQRANGNNGVVIYGH